MKSINKVLTVILLGIGVCAVAQTPPAPPAPPVTPTTVYQDDATKVTTNSSNVSVITQSGDYGKGGNTSFSVSNSNDEYRIKARFPQNRYAALKGFLLKELGSNGMQSSGDDFVWTKEADDDTVYEIELSKTKLKVDLDKELASPELIAKFEDMGTITRTLISGGDRRQEVSRLEREAARARRDAERMQQEAERLQAMSERESARLAREAERLTREADQLSLVSKRGGGIDGYVREILNEPSTKYTANMQASKYWKWPELQKALITSLKKDNLLDDNENIVLIKEDRGMYVNGEQLSPAQWSSYNQLFRKYGYGNMDELSFYKSGDHIVVINSPSNFEALLQALEENDLISDRYTTSTIEINGSTIIVDGKKLSQTQTDRWNKLLESRQVIPAPGKTIKIGKDFASIGYSFGKRTLGFWMSRK